VTDDERDNAGIVAPPPLIYLTPLVLGLLLNRKFPVSFLPRRIARIFGWPFLGGGVLFMGWFEWAMRHAGTPPNPYKPVSHMVTEGPFRYTRNPGYLSMTIDLCGHRRPRECALGHPTLAGGAVRDPARSDRTRGALPGRQVRRGVPAIQSAGAALDLSTS
jgi:protein-S-isoprenylcysteine O-methyltransferase Ste14